MYSCRTLGIFSNNFHFLFCERTYVREWRARPLVSPLLLIVFTPGLNVFIFTSGVDCVVLCQHKTGTRYIINEYHYLVAVRSGGQSVRCVVGSLLSSSWQRAEANDIIPGTAAVVVDASTLRGIQYQIHTRLAARCDCLRQFMKSQQCGVGWLNTRWWGCLSLKTAARNSAPRHLPVGFVNPDA